ncbi:MAG: hypothetical protein NC043_07675 [Muribaculaceae bacterium]|nr:hypothetical protein [Muribaculaceae bacterium]
MRFQSCHIYESPHEERYLIMTSEEFKSDILPHYQAMWSMAYTLLADSDEAADAVQGVCSGSGTRVTGCQP